MQYFFRFFSQKSVIIGQNQQIKAEFYWQDAPFPFLSPFVSRCCIQSFRLYKTFCSHKRRGKWPFVEVCKGTKAVPLPLLCASFFSQKKGQLPVFDGAAGKLPQSACAASPLKEGAKIPLTPAVCSAIRQSEQSSVAVEGGAVRTEKYRSQSRRLYKTFCSHKRRGKWPFVEVCKGTKAVPLPLLCASFFSQKKGQLPVFDGAAGKLPQSACAASPLKEGAKYSYKNSPSLLVQTGGVFKVLITAKVRLYPAWTVPPASRPNGRCGSSSRPASRQHTVRAAEHRQTAQ